MSGVCKDLRHVCGGCGFKWPERSAYDALTSDIAALRERVATLEAQSAEWERLANYARDNYTRRNTEALAEKARADTAESATVEAIAAWLENVEPIGNGYLAAEIRCGDWKKLAALLKQLSTTP